MAINQITHKDVDADGNILAAARGEREALQRRVLLRSRKLVVIYVDLLVLRNSRSLFDRNMCVCCVLLCMHTSCGFDEGATPRGAAAEPGPQWCGRDRGERAAERRGKHAEIGVVERGTGRRRRH